MFILQLVITFLQLFNFVLLARVLLSWIPMDTSNPTIAQIVGFIHDVTEPVLAPVRNALPQTGMIDLSPLIVFFGISFVTSILASAL